MQSPSPPRLSPPRPSPPRPSPPRPSAPRPRKGKLLGKGKLLPLAGSPKSWSTQPNSTMSSGEQS
ncbi:MAG TPA: hypothetical protein EYP98_11925 [Planctomycetes bacterium]|nr:hypothetical protein [Planctomycetota bacterium]